MPDRGLTRRHRRLIDQLYGTGRFFSIGGSAKQLNLNPQLVKAYAKQKDYVTKLRKRTTLGLSLTLAAALIGGIVWLAYPRPTRTEITVTPRTKVEYNGGFSFGTANKSSTFFPQEELTLENAKQRFRDTKFGQAYLDRLLETGNVKFQWTEVVYDPDSRKAIEFLESQLRHTEDSKKEVLLKRKLKKQNLTKLI